MKLLPTLLTLTILIALSGCGSAGDSGPVPLAVSGVSPSNNQTGIAIDSDLQITFDRPILTISATMQLSNGPCTESIQISSDNFSTCLSGTLDTSANPVIMVTGLSFQSLTTYKLRVTTGVTNISGDPLPGNYTMANGFTTRYGHKIALDGINDFTAQETFSTSTTGYTAYVAWDTANIYIGVDGADIGLASNSKYLVFYLSGTGSTTTNSLTFSSQSTTLPFPAAYALSYRLDTNSTTAYLEFFGGWTGTSVVVNTISATIGNYIEFSLPKTTIGSPNTLNLHMSIVDTTGGSETTYSGLPASSFTDGLDPLYSKYYDFDLLGSVTPASHTALP